MKYIISTKGEVVMFSSSLNHKDIAKKLGMNVRSAGFVQGEPNLYTHGKSYSLDIGRHETDEAVIENALLNE